MINSGMMNESQNIHIISSQILNKFVKKEFFGQNYWVVWEFLAVEILIGVVTSYWIVDLIER